MAQGVIAALAQVEVKIPVVIRLEGTNAQEASELLHDSEHDFIVASRLSDAAERAVQAAKQEN